MAKISLRVYNREIESLIEGGQLDEAVAHCHHILKTYPMHIETYRLLGKAFLEGRRYGDATDIFQRVLNSVPDDFVAHVGMSIIRDDEGKLDESIWHMERAFQVQPSNPAIQNELRRLYGRRDGLEPPKIRLSRDALANMYVQGDLYVQAIAEIRALLVDDPNRADLLAMLAKAYLKAGQKVEAADIAAQLLKKSPYCMDALRVLVEVLPGTTRADNTQVYRQRLRLLEPYTAMLTGSVFNPEQVSDGTIMMDRLDYQPGTSKVSAQPSWASALGVDLEKDAGEPASPTWMTTNVPGKVPTSLEADLPESGEIENANEALPEFLREAGWQESNGEVAGQQQVFDSTVGEETIEKGEMPEWLQAMAPASDLVQEQDGQKKTEERDENLPEWLAGLGLASTVGENAPGSSVEEAPGSSSTSEGFSSSGSAEASEIGTKLFPDFRPESETPITSKPMELNSDQVGPFLASGDVTDIPLTEPMEASQETLITEPRQGKPLGIEEDTMAWLESLAERQGAKPEELLSKPEERSEDVPDWLKEFSETQPEMIDILPEEKGILDSSETRIESEAPDHPDVRAVADINSQDESPSTKQSPDDEFPDWLKGMADEQAGPRIDQAPSESSPLTDIYSQPEAKTDQGQNDDIPDWLKGMVQMEPAPDLEPDISGDARKDEPAKLTDANLTPESPGEFTEWLKTAEIGAATGVPDEKPVTFSGTEQEQIVPPPAREKPEDLLPLEIEKVSDSGEILPEEPTQVDEDGGLDKIGEVTDMVQEDIHQAAKPLEIEDATMAWLESLAAKQGAKAEELLTTPAERSDISPDWLKAIPAEEEEFLNVEEKQGPEDSVSTEQHPIEEIPSGLEIQAPEASAGSGLQAGQEASTEQDLNMPAWLKGGTLDTTTSPIEKGTEPDNLDETSTEIPEWLKDFDEGLPESIGTQESPEAEIPDWLKKPVDFETNKTREQPVQPEYPAIGEDAGPGSDGLPAPTSPEEWIPEDEITPATEGSVNEPSGKVDELPEESRPKEISQDSGTEQEASLDDFEVSPGIALSKQVFEPQPVSEIPGIEKAKASVIPSDKDASLLIQAQEALENGDLNGAMAMYTKLIRKNRWMEEVIRDLRKAIDRFPVDSIIWQTLGDAYMRASRLQDALDAYTKAEELLR